MCAYPHLCVMFVPIWVENRCGFMDMGAGPLPLIEALVYMPRIDVCESVLAYLEESLPNQIFQFSIHIHKDGD